MGAVHISKFQCFAYITSSLASALTLAVVQEQGEPILSWPTYDEIGIFLLQSECEGDIRVSVLLTIDDSLTGLHAAAVCRQEHVHE